MTIEDIRTVLETQKANVLGFIPFSDTGAVYERRAA